jgi:hypothetical protein
VDVVSTFEDKDIVFPREFQNLLAARDGCCCSCRVTSVLFHNQHKSKEPSRMRTGTVYKTLGFGLDEGQFSKAWRRDSGLIPSPSVSTSISLAQHISENIQEA